MKNIAGFAVGLGWAWLIGFGPSPWREAATVALVGCIVVGVVLAVVHGLRAVTRSADELAESEVAAVAALAALYPEARIEGPGVRVTFMPYSCEGMPCEPVAAVDPQPDGMRRYGCLWCANTWEVSA